MTVPTNVVDRVTLITAVRDRLNEQLPVTTPPTNGYLTEPVDVPLLDGSHVQRYWVLHPFGGLPAAESDIADVQVDLTWGFQLTVAAAYAMDCYDLATRVDAALARWIPVVDGYVCGALRPPPGFDPGPARVDEAYKPHRFWLPLQYQTTITRAS